jgi:hypothetical protein
MDAYDFEAERIRLAEQYKGLDLPKILLEWKEFALSGGIPGVAAPHYARASSMLLTVGGAILSS